MNLLPVIELAGRIACPSEPGRHVEEWQADVDQWRGPERLIRCLSLFLSAARLRADGDRWFFYHLMSIGMFGSMYFEALFHAVHPATQTSMASRGAYLMLGFLFLLCVRKSYRYVIAR